MHRLTSFLACGLCATASAAEFPEIRNTQNPNENPPTPQEAAEAITVPEGFAVSLFAGEPEVQQPIAFEFDDRGRLWVAENYTYTGHGFDLKSGDRLVILEDKDHDGSADGRKVFWDGGKALTAVAFGFGGVWVLNDGTLSLIPDANGDDVPDGAPVPLVDGFDVERVGHNIVNGLLWGPDGWLYGRHGITAPSMAAVVETPENERKKLSCGLWRYHPTRKVFEMVLEGTTNPWGHDYNDFGEMFFTNNVIGHLWHALPGAHFKRMFGADTNPYVFELLDQHADHYHWDNGKNWTDSRDTSGVHGELGGGHSHCGGMIYLGDNWPDEYRNNIFMCNTHGRRINENLLERSGSGYVGKRAPDFLFANQPWFKGVTIKSGPDGAVFVSDWVDLGECHDNDGVHRTSGRIYKVAYGRPVAPKAGLNLGGESVDALLDYQGHKNDWYVRRARRILQERAADASVVAAVKARAAREIAENPDVTRKLRYLWALNAVGAADEGTLTALLGHGREEMRVWALRLLVDNGPVSPGVLEGLVAMAREDASGLVRLYLASALQKLPFHQRWNLAEGLAGHEEDASDHNLPLMIWYGVEAAVPAQPGKAVALAASSRIPKVREFIVRRLMLEAGKQPGPVVTLLKSAVEKGDAAYAGDILRGIAAAVRGWRKAEPLEGWDVFVAKFGSGDAGSARLVKEISVVFGDGQALEVLLQIARDGEAPVDARRNAVRVLAESKAEHGMEMLKGLLGDRALQNDVLAAMAAFDDPAIPDLVIGGYRNFDFDGRRAGVTTLASRPAFARKLLEAVRKGWIPRGDIPAFAARQMGAFGDSGIDALLREQWGTVRSTPEDKLQLIAEWKGKLTDVHLRGADLSQGRLAFTQLCSACHKLYGEGGNLGPELTGSNRDNIEYLLQNIIDPNASVPVEFKISMVTMKDGRVLSGAVAAQDERTVTLNSAGQITTLDRTEVTKLETLDNSVMPEGLFVSLAPDQVRDLIAYLRNQHQIPLPEAEE